MAVTTTQINKPLNPRGNDQSPKEYNRAKLYSGKALDFDGTNDEMTPSGSYFVNPQSGTWTFCAYIYAENSGVVFSRDNQYVEFRLYGGKLVAKVYAGGWQVLTLSNVVLLDEWYFVCWKYDVDNSTFTGYVNGVEQLTETLVPDVVLNFDRIASTGGSNFFEGKIGGIKIYDVGLTEAQVANLYNNPEKIVPTGVANSALKLWFPMQEGAGTTAYDGSGNGNHGTISGATWTHGIGAPVSQTAVIDWNKGQNNLTYSEDFSQYGTGGDAVVTSGFSAPDGSNNAYKISSALSNGSIFRSGESGANYYRSIYARTTSGTGTVDLLSYFENTNNTFTITEEWQRFEVNTTDSSGGVNNFYGVDFRNPSATLNEVILWGAHTKSDSSSGPYVPTFGTTQTSDVLLPQGLTTGRDITGVNLFTYARKQSALNLDGNSWAEVHDNASLDFGTGEFTLEAWVIKNYVNSGSSINVIMSLGDNVASANNTGLTANSTNVGFKYVGYQTHNVTTGDWVHVVGVYDETNAILYVDGVEETTTARTAINITNALVKQIGRDSTTSRYYADQIAQPRIYNRALTADEVQKNYEAGKNTYS